MDILKFSEALLFQVKIRVPVSATVEALKSASMLMLRDSLDDDQKKKAFWINIYNAYFQTLRAEHNLQKPEIFRKKMIHIAGAVFSLDDVEHGILRRYRFKWGLGLLPDPFAPALIKKLAVSRPDYRIHFALNCGAISCPPIASYSSDLIDRQLELATLAFLESETYVNHARKEIHTTPLFQWYLGDFGGIRGVRRLLREKIHVSTHGMRLVFKPYDWSEALHNYSNSNLK